MHKLEPLSQNPLLSITFRSETFEPSRSFRVTVACSILLLQVKSSHVYIRDSSMVHPVSLVCFAGKNITVIGSKQGRRSLCFVSSISLLCFIFVLSFRVLLCFILLCSALLCSALLCSALLWALLCSGLCSGLCSALLFSALLVCSDAMRCEFELLHERTGLKVRQQVRQ